MAREKKLILTEFKSATWLPGGHAQTIYPALFMWKRAARYRREAWVTPDLDSIVVDWTAGRAGTPLIVLFHGLEGSSHSHYALSLFTQAYKQGWRGVVPHFRTCGHVQNRLPRAYHAGDSEEINWVLRRIRKAFPDSPLFAVGISLGGNALLKWLAEQGSAANMILDAAVAVSAPMDLVASGTQLDVGINRHLYVREFLRTLRYKTQMKLKLNENPYIDWQQVKQVKTIREFDHLVTAPLHGFHSVEHYWQSASSKPLLNQITLPTLIINALNDPFILANSLPQQHEVASCITLLRPAEGGHVGFVDGAWPGKLTWLPENILRFFQYHLPLPR